MQLILKNTGVTIPFITWLKGFKDISSTILIEVDLVENKFISKCFPESRAIVKYSEISFESAGYEVKDILDNDGNSILTNKNTLKAEYKKEFTGDNRIKVGIYNILNKVIDVALMYSDNIEHTLSVDFDLSTNVKYVGADKGVKQYQAEKLIFDSKTLTYNINCSVLSEFFRFLTDDVFANISKLGGEISINVTPETISNLNRISQLFMSDKTRAAIKFYTKKTEDTGTWALYAYDETDKSYNYLLGYYADDQHVSDTSIVILRENFINATKAINTDMQIVISATALSRIVITTPDAQIIVASHQN